MTPTDTFHNPIEKIDASEDNKEEKRIIKKGTKEAIKTCTKKTRKKNRTSTQREELDHCFTKV